MKRLYRIRQMLSKLEQQRLMNEHDEMSMIYLKHSIEPGELVEYSRGTVREAKNAKWIGLSYLDDEKQMGDLKSFIQRADLGKLIVGVTSFPLFMKCRTEILPEGNVDVILFKNFAKDQEFLELCTMVQELEELNEFEYIVVVEKGLMKMGNVQYDELTRMLTKNPESFILPHQMMRLEGDHLYTPKNKRHYRLNNDYYYVSSFDPSFELDARSTTYYTIRSPVRFVRMKGSFACRTNSFKSLALSDYYFDKSESVFLSLLQTEKCLFLTSPKVFYIEEESQFGQTRSR